MSWWYQNWRGAIECNGKTKVYTAQCSPIPIDCAFSSELGYLSCSGSWNDLSPEGLLCRHMTGIIAKSPHYRGCGFAPKIGLKITFVKGVSKKEGQRATYPILPHNWVLILVEAGHERIVGNILNQFFNGTDDPLNKPGWVNCHYIPNNNHGIRSTKLSSNMLRAARTHVISLESMCCFQASTIKALDAPAVNMPPGHKYANYTLRKYFMGLTYPIMLPTDDDGKVLPNIDEKGKVTPHKRAIFGIEANTSDRLAMVGTHNI